jgi:cytochrome c oxidase assembly factor CtaG
MLWAWHIPALYDAALANRAVHVLEHAGFLATAALFWWAVLLGHGHRPPHGAGVLYTFGLAAQSTALGAMLTFARTPWYTSHLTSAARHGLSPLEDQQLAGLIMWVPGGLVYLGLALGLFAVWLKSGEAPPAAARTPARR